MNVPQAAADAAREAARPFAADIAEHAIRALSIQHDMEAAEIIGSAVASAAMAALEAAAPHIAAAKDAKLAAVRALAENLGDRSKDLNRLPPTDRRLMEPLRRMLLEILDAP